MLPRKTKIRSLRKKKLKGSSSICQIKGNGKKIGIGWTQTIWFNYQLLKAAASSDELQSPVNNITSHIFKILVYHEVHHFFQTKSLPGQHKQKVQSWASLERKAVIISSFFLLLLWMLIWCCSNFTQNRYQK